MNTTDLLKEILLNPIVTGAEKLRVVSGYATAGMASLHFDLAKKKKLNLDIELLIGMTGYSGLPVSYHKGFQKLVEFDYPKEFQCSYIFKGPPVHSKVYVWLKDEKPILAYAGSANYTQTGFGVKQREILTSCDPVMANKYVDRIVGDSIYCTHADVESVITIFSDRQYFKQVRKTAESPEAFNLDTENEESPTFPCVSNSFLNSSGKLGSRSGLNWGQRPNLHREPNQAYLPLRSSVYNSDFFPPRGAWFALRTDDGITFLCKRRQDSGKAIHTPQNNSQFGEYFRRRLGLAFGEPITKANLEHYGRTDVLFCKLDDEHYTMDFSV